MGYRTQSEDTTRDAEAVQIELWRRMTPVRKFACFAALQQAAVRLAECGIRQRHPQAGPREVFLRRAALMLDRETMIRVYGWDPAGAESP